MSEIFAFKQFSVCHDKSTMRVGTDAVLLGAFLKILSENREINSILDVGTGCGVLALIATQKFHAANVLAIDIDADSVAEADTNFRNSPWKNRLCAMCTSLQDFIKSQDNKFDVIISNPPYFENSLKCSSKAKNKARHNDTLPFAALAVGTRKLLKNTGCFVCILPKTEAEKLIALCRIEKLYCNHIINIFSKCSDCEAKRIVMKFEFSEKVLIAADFYIRNDDNSYTDDYYEAVKDLLLVGEE